MKLTITVTPQEWISVRTAMTDGMMELAGLLSRDHADADKVQLATWREDLTNLTRVLENTPNRAVCLDRIARPPCALCDRGDGQLGHSDDCKNK